MCICDPNREYEGWEASLRLRLEAWICDFVQVVVEFPLLQER
jgi:hypothetical protein